MVFYYYKFSEILTGMGACHSGGLGIFRSKTLIYGSARTSCRYLPSLRTIGLSRYCPIMRRGGKCRQRSVRSARLFLARVCVTGVVTIKRVCLAEAVLGMQ